jgi:hypothetical protein
MNSDHNGTAHNTGEIAPRELVDLATELGRPARNLAQ